MSPTSAILSLFIIFQFDSSLYSFQKNYIKVSNTFLVTYLYILDAFNDTLLGTILQAILSDCVGELTPNVFSGCSVPALSS